MCLQGSIDQVDGLIRFDTASEQLLQWDEQIQKVCNQLNGIADHIISKETAVGA